MQLTHANWLLCTEIDRDTAAEFYKLLAKTASHQHVLLLIDSHGGDPLVAAGLAYTLQRKYPVLETRVVGRAHSAAVDLLIAGTLRTSYPHAEFITHPTREEVEVNPHNARKMAELVRRQNELILHRYVEQCGKDLKFWREFFKEERFLHAKDAKKLGLIHRIL